MVDFMEEYMIEPSSDIFTTIEPKGESASLMAKEVENCPVSGAKRWKCAQISLKKPSQCLGPVSK
jgi:hypothetical protein